MKNLEPLTMESQQVIGTYNTPKGRLLWPNLVTPSTKFNANGEYSAQILVPKADAAELMRLLDANHASVVALVGPNTKVFDVPYDIDINKDTKAPTGLIRFKIRSAAGGISRKTGKAWESPAPLLFDSAGNRIAPGTCNPGGGTMARVGFELSRYWYGTGAGIKLKLNAVQVIDLVEFSGRPETADGYGFDAEGGGYEAPDSGDAPFGSGGGSTPTDF